MGKIAQGPLPGGSIAREFSLKVDSMQGPPLKVREKKEREVRQRRTNL